MPRKDQDNLTDASAKTVIIRDGPHKGKYITHGKPRRWYSLEVKEPDNYAYYVLVEELKVGRGQTKGIIYVYAFQQIDGPETAMAVLRREWKRDGKQYDLEKF